MNSILDDHVLRQTKVHRKNIHNWLAGLGRRILRKDAWKMRWPSWVLTDEQESATLEQGERLSRELVWRQSGVEEHVAFGNASISTRQAACILHEGCFNFFRFNVLHPKYYVSFCTVKTTYVLIDLSSIKERIDSIYMIYEAKLNSIVSRK